MKFEDIPDVKARRAGSGAILHMTAGKAANQVWPCIGQNEPRRLFIIALSHAMRGKHKSCNYLSLYVADANANLSEYIRNWNSPDCAVDSFLLILTGMELPTQRSNTPLVESALASLREVIALLPPSNGNRLPSEPVLAERLRISRPVLRQALSVLKNEGLIESRKGSGTYRNALALNVTTFGAPENLSDLDDCMRFRMVVESAAAGLAALRGSDMEVAEIRKHVEVMESGQNRENQMFDTDMDFHFAIARASRSRYYAMTLQLLKPHIIFGLNLGRQMHKVSPTATSKRVAAEHRAVFFAIEKRDADGAAEKMREHLLAGIERIFGRREY